MNVIVMQFNVDNVELVASVLDIATQVCWESEEGFLLVYHAFEHYRVQHGHKDYLDPIVKALQRTKNVIVVE